MFETRTSRRRLLASAGAAGLLVGRRARAQSDSSGKVWKVGVLGVMRGPAASWGLVNKDLRRGDRPDVQRAGRV